MNDYAKALNEAMLWLAAQPDTIFLGQSVGQPGTAIFNTLEGVPADRRLELPVMEDAQMGMSTGLALSGFVPITIYPRWSFLLLATSQLVLHLDKLPFYSNGRYRPRVIIRTAVPTNVPLDPGAQHLGDFSWPFAMMLNNVQLFNIVRAEQILPAYQDAYTRDGPRATLICERTERYA